MKTCSLLPVATAFFAWATAFGAPADPPRTLPQLTVQENVIRPIPLGMTGRAIMPWFGYSEPPVLLVVNHSPYIAQRNDFYRAVGKDGSKNPLSLPADYPIYKAEPFEPVAKAAGGLSAAGYLVVDRKAEGLFDLVYPGTLRYYRNIGTPGKPKFDRGYAIPTAQPRKDGQMWIEDVTGDGVPDLLVGAMSDPADYFKQFPDADTEKGPWSGEDHPDMGSLPDTDIQNFRGYDVLGNWMAAPLRKYLWWAKGVRDTQGRLSFGEYKPVRYGSTDYKVQCQYWGNHFCPVVVHAENGDFIVMVTGPDRVLALPLRGETSDGELRTGKAVPLLKNGSTTLSSVLLPQVIGRGDFNGDGVEEIVLGSGGNGRFTVLASKRVGEFEELGNIDCKGGPVAGDTLVTVARGDWDGDGTDDLVLGDASGYYTLWRGSKDPLVYRSFEYLSTPEGVIRHRPTEGNLQGAVEAAWSYTEPALFDWDGDGKLDLISNDNAAQLLFYRNTGNPPLVEPARPFMMGGKPLPVAWRTRLGVVPGKYRLAGDDRNCLLFMTWDRKMAYAVPTSNGSLDIERVVDFAYEDGSPVILSGPVGLSGRVKFTVYDWDGDGRWDVVLGVQQALQKYFRLPGAESPSPAPFWLRNVGTNDKPLFEPARMITFDDGKPIVLKKHDFSAFPTDLFKRGAADLIFGDDEGFIFYMPREKLAWNESVEPLKQAWATEARLRVSGADLPVGVFAAEKWDYPEGPLASANGGQGWDGPWQAEGPQAVVETVEVGQTGAFADFAGGHCLSLAGEDKQTVVVRRALAKPFAFVQKSPRTLACAVAFRREDNTDNDSKESIALLSLRNPSGEVVLSAGFDSTERLELKVGASAMRGKGRAADYNGGGVLYVEIDLPSDENAPVKMRAKFSPTELSGPVTAWDVEVAGKANAVASAVAIVVGKQAGRVSISPFVLNVR